MYIALHYADIHEKHLILSEVKKLTSVLFKSGYTCSGSLYYRFTLMSS